tara:strand:- start:1 stop:360 length:360 start_codon:yes stop_codon:yes gene_type:complete
MISDSLPSNLAESAGVAKSTVTRKMAQKGLPYSFQDRVLKKLKEAADGFARLYLTSKTNGSEDFTDYKIVMDRLLNFDFKQSEDAMADLYRLIYEDLNTNRWSPFLRLTVKAQTHDARG